MDAIANILSGIMPSGLRMLALFFGAGLIILSFYRFRIHVIGGRDFIIAQTIGFALFVMALNPHLSDYILLLFNWKQGEYTPVIAVLFLACFLLFYLYIDNRKEGYRHEMQINKLVHVIGVKEFFDTYGEFHFPPILVIIPAFREEEAIGRVLSRIPKKVHGVDVGVLVVVDGYGDPSAEVARAHDVFVALNIINRGYGSALQLGFLLAEMGNAKYLVTMDADGQHQPEEIEKLVLPIIDNSKDLIIGSRIMGFGAHISTLRSVGLRFFNLLLRVLVQTPTTDCSSGFRAFTTEAVIRLNLEEYQYQTAELFIEASSKKLRIGEVPITITARLSGTTKKGSDIQFGINFFKSMMKAWIRQKR